MTYTKKAFLYLTCAAVLFGGLSLGAQSLSPSRGIDGAWLVSVNFDLQGLPPCAPAPAAAFAHTPNEGTIIAESCWSSEGTGYGTWRRTGQNRYAITFKGNSFAPDGTVWATYTVRATASVESSTGMFSGPFQTQLFDLSGNLLDTLTGTISAVRIEE